MECGGKRSATPLWLERLVLRWIWHKHKPKRRRASLAAALHMAVADTLNRTHRARWFRRSIILELAGVADTELKPARAAVELIMTNGNAVVEPQRPDGQVQADAKPEVVI